MPIEFNCRICNATIRVPDKAAGGKGKCPKCGLRITVPKKSPAKPAPKPAEPEEQFVLPGITDETIAYEEPVLDSDSDEVVVLEPAGFDPDDLTEPPKDEFSFDQAAMPSRPRPSKRRLTHRKRNNTAMIIAVVGALVLLAGVAFYIYPLVMTERISADLTAGVAGTLDLPPVVINKSRIDLPAEELDGLLKKLESSPIPLTSNSMQIELSGTAKGLQISVASTSQSHFYRVSLKGNESIQKYLDRHLSDFEDQRRREVDQAVTNFFLEYQNVIAKKSASEKIIPFRDSLAIPALVRGFGHYLVAEYGRALYRCVYEDRDGGLYFLLPPDVASFKVVGRRGSDDRPLVQVEFQVKVDGEIAQPKIQTEKSTKSPPISKPKSDKAEQKRDEEKIPGKK